MNPTPVPIASVTDQRCPVSLGHPGWSEFRPPHSSKRSSDAKNARDIPMHEGRLRICELSRSCLTGRGAHIPRSQLPPSLSWSASLSFVYSLA